MKRLGKNTNDKMICGVCSGIAAYFDIDPTLVRILWAILSISGGGGLIIYIIAAIVMPDMNDFDQNDYYDSI